jgi:hypothetical protein
MRSERVPIDGGTLCPVSDVVLSRLYRADGSEVEAIAMALPINARSRLAVFCFSRSHLRDIGRQIASMCDPVILMREGGARLGHALLAVMPEKHPHQGFHKPGVTLARPADMRARLAAADNVFDVDFRSQGQ